MDNNETLILDLSETKKQRVLVDGDENRVLYLNLSDMNMLVRYKEKYEELQKLKIDALSKTNDDSDDFNNIMVMADVLKKIDNAMRDAIDYIFDANVCEVCVESGSMYDPINGKMRYEYIVEALGKLYNKNMEAETKKLEKNISKHTNKYIGKK